MYWALHRVNVLTMLMTKRKVGKSELAVYKIRDFVFLSFSVRIYLIILNSLVSGYNFNEDGNSSEAWNCSFKIMVHFLTEFSSQPTAGQLGSKSDRSILNLILLIILNSLVSGYNFNEDGNSSEAWNCSFKIMVHFLTEFSSQPTAGQLGSKSDRSILNLILLWLLQAAMILIKLLLFQNKDWMSKSLRKNHVIKISDLTVFDQELINA